MRGAGFVGVCVGGAVQPSEGSKALGAGRSMGRRGRQMGMHGCMEFA